MAKRKGFEGSPADVAQDKKMAKKYGINMKQWERSAADKKQDAKPMRRGFRGR